MVCQSEADIAFAQNLGKSHVTFKQNTGMPGKTQVRVQQTCRWIAGGADFVDLGAIAAIILPLSLNAAGHFKDKALQSQYCFLDPRPGSGADAVVFNNDSAQEAKNLHDLLSHSFAAGPDMLAVQCWVLKVDTTAYTAELACRLSFFGNYAKPPSFTRLDLSRLWPPDSQLVFEFTSSLYTTLSDGEGSQLNQFTVQLASDMDAYAESALMYPAMRLSFKLMLGAYVINNTTKDLVLSVGDASANISQATPPYPQVPLSASLTANYMPLYEVERLRCLQNKAQRMLVLTGIIVVDNLSRKLLVAMNVMMWALAASTFTACVWWIMAPVGTTTTHDLLSFAGALLFALPAMRGLWPAAPVGSTLLDLLCIWPQLMLISFGIIGVLAKNMWMLNDDDPNLRSCFCV